MGAMHRLQAIRQYQNSGAAATTYVARPEELVAMLLGGALDRIARARGAALNGDRPTRHASVSAAIAIVEHLRLCLDRGAGPLAERLDALYDFALRHLARANAADDPEMLAQVADVLRPLKSAWDEIRPA